jgi:hypothetical protein
LTSRRVPPHDWTPPSSLPSRSPNEERLASAATVIQRFARGHLARLHRRAAVAAVLTLQAGARGMLARLRAREARRQKAALAVQTAWRRHKLREEYKHAHMLVVAVQALWRGRQVRDAGPGARAGHRPPSCCRGGGFTHHKRVPVITAHRQRALMHVSMLDSCGSPS